jgi:hypothetical protein
MMRLSQGFAPGDQLHLTLGEVRQLWARMEPVKPTRASKRQPQATADGRGGLRAAEVIVNPLVEWHWFG